MNWQGGCAPTHTVAQYLDEFLHDTQAREQVAFPDLRRAREVVLAFDSAGSHKGSAFTAYSYLLADISALNHWVFNIRNLWRDRIGDSRRLSYKELRDAHLQRNLPFFLDCVDELPGLLFVIAIQRSFRSLFAETVDWNKQHPELSEYSRIPGAVFEEMNRFCCFATVLLGGLSAPAQNVRLLMDNDQINQPLERRELLIQLLNWHAGLAVPHRFDLLTHTTSDSDEPTRELEDILSIPDLAGGALSSFLIEYRDSPSADSDTGLYVPPSSKEKTKDQYLLSWLGRKDSPLVRCLIVVTGNGEGLSATLVRPRPLSGTP